MGNDLQNLVRKEKRSTKELGRLKRFFAAELAQTTRATRMELQKVETQLAGLKAETTVPSSSRT